jgi:acetyltransferase-like isoleucine patch superfamily enzyme
MPGTFLSRVAYKALKKLRMRAVSSSTVPATSKLESGTSFYHSSIDRYSFCGYDCDVYYADIGAFTSIANNVVIGGGRHPMDWVGMSPVFYEGRDSVRAKFAMHRREPARRVIVGNDVWIGRSAIILPGATVGDGAVVGAGSVVTKDVAPYAIVAGNPARLVRFRFDDETIARLLASKWWDLPDADLQRLGPLVTDVQRFLEVVERRAKA